jgi:RNA polymerase sigma-54 factor
MTVLELAASQRQQQRLWPALVALARVLVLPVAGLEAAIEHEVGENPALVRDEVAGGCPATCAWCARAAAAGPRDRGPDGREAPDVPAPAAGDLLADARPLLREREARLAEYVVASLDDRGLLACSPDEIARATGATPAELEHVVGVLRGAGPVSTAARDVREALLLQLEAMGDAAPVLARRLVEDHLDALASGAFAGAARALGVTRAEVVEARDFIRTRLQPPSRAAERGGAVAPAPPDIVVRELPDGALAVDLPDARHVRVRVDPLWLVCAGDANRPAAERALARELIDRARAFAQRLEDRRRTLQAIAELTVHRQESFARGQAPPMPLTRATIARAAAVHESTVSRAVAAKLVQLPSGRVVPFASFFHAALGAEAALASIVAHEERPLSDAGLAAELGRLGYPMARRTVTKYRGRLGIVAHTVR